MTSPEKGRLRSETDPIVRSPSQPEVSRQRAQSEELKQSKVDVRIVKMKNEFSRRLNCFFFFSQYQLAENSDERKRLYNSVFAEIIQTEKDYVSDLTVLLDVFKKPMEDAKIVDNSTINQIFSNVIGIQKKKKKKKETDNRKNKIFKMRKKKKRYFPIK